MDVSNAHEDTLLIPIAGTPAANHDNRRSHQKELAICMILASTLFERIAFYSLSGNFAPSLQLSNDDSCSTTVTGAFMFSGISYLSTLIFAVISDAKLGRCKTIIMGFVFYLIGYTLASILANKSSALCSPKAVNYTDILNTNPVADSPSTNWMNVALIIIAVGAGAVKSNLAVFGAEQKGESIVTSQYFDQYFIAVNIGIMIATLYTPTMSVIIGNNSSSAYLFATSMIFLAMVTFLIGYPFYKHATPFDSVITMCFPVLWNACQTWYQIRRNSQYRPFNLSNSHSETENSTELDQRPATFLDYAKVKYHGRFLERIVDDVKSLRSAFMVFILLIPYWLIYNQLYTTFPSQGERMRLSGPRYFVFWMTLGDPITIIVGTTIFNLFLYKYLNARNQSLTTIRKFIIGMFLASITMFISGGVEVVRQHYCPGTDGNSTLSVYTQLSQSSFMGLSELFATVACFEFSYFAAPRSAQSLFMSLYYCTVGLASFLSTGYIALFSTTASQLDFTCPPISQNYSKYYNYFFVLAGIQLFFVIIFVVVQKKYQIININPERMTPHR